MMLCVSRAKLQLLLRPQLLHLLLSRPLNRNQLQSLLLNQSRLRPQLLLLNQSQLRPQLLLLRLILVCWCVLRRLLTARWCWSGTMLLMSTGIRFVATVRGLLRYLLVLSVMSRQMMVIRG